MVATGQKEFDDVWTGMCEAFRSRNKMRAISVIRWVIFGGIVAAKNYVERYWERPDGLEAMREDLMGQMGIKKQEEEAEIKKPERVIRQGCFQLIIKGDEEVTWEQVNEFFGKVSNELGL